VTPADRALAVGRAREELCAAHALLERPALAAAATAHVECAAAIAAALGAAVPAADDVAARARALGRSIAAVEPPVARARRLRGWIARTALVVALLATAVILARPRPVASGGVWRAQYFQNRHFHGEPLDTYDRVVDVDWGDGIPRFGFPYDGFSVRWHACLVLDAPQSVTLALTSYDGSRVLVDDRIVVDNWGDHELRTARSTLELAAGAHLVEVRYTTHRGRSGVSLYAAFGDGPLAPLLLLRRPTSTRRCDPPH
jgi:hypothetical protein